MIVAVGATSLVGGYLAGRSATQPQAHPVEQIRATAASPVNQAGAPLLARSSVEIALDSAPLTEHESRLNRDLGDDALGTQMRRALIAQNHQEIPGVDAYAQSFVTRLAQDSEHGTDTVKAALNRISPDAYPLERVALIAALGTNPKNADAVRALALQEFTESPPAARPNPETASTPRELDEALSTTPAQARPITAQGIFLKNARDSAEALAGTLAGITRQQDWGIRATLARQFLEAYPSIKPELLASLDRSGISVDLGQEEQAE